MSIYKIVGGSEIYVGSTKSTLEERFKQHIQNYKVFKKGKRNYVTSYDLFDKYGIDNCRIELIETVEENLKKREGHYQKTIDCINKRVEGRTKKEHYNDNIEAILNQKKQYYEANKDEMNNKMNKYRIDNRDALLNQKKQYYEANKEAILQKVLEYSKLNKEKIRERGSKTTQCECGIEHRIYDTKRHLKSKRHISYASKVKLTSS